jgi:hypothetical protein
VTADRVDVVAADCELVSRLVSRDASGGDGQHETQVEPSAAASGRMIVTTFQSGRRHKGGANRIGFSTSRDGGRTWRAGFLPALTNDSRPPGTATLASDPVVAFDAAHGVWLISTLAVGDDVTQLFISRSIDGVNWGPPVVAASFTGSELAFDKNWIACDDWRSSPRRGRCYLAYTDDTARQPGLAIQRSDDGGQTWSPEQVLFRNAEAVGVLPLPRPDGSLVITYLGDGVVQSVRSTDGGVTFEQPVTISRYFQRPVRPLRTFPLPSADVDARGRLYVAWQDCRFGSGCPANDIVLSALQRRRHVGDAHPADARRRQRFRARDRGRPFERPAGGGLPPVLGIAVPRGRARHDVEERRELVEQPAAADRSADEHRLAADDGLRAHGRRLHRGRLEPRARGAVYSLASPPGGGELHQAIAAARVP